MSRSVAVPALSTQMAMSASAAELSDSAARQIGLQTPSQIGITLREHHRLLVHVEHCEADRPGKLGSLRGSKQAYVDRCASLQAALGYSTASWREEPRGAAAFEFIVNRPPSAFAAGTRKQAWGPKVLVDNSRWVVITRSTPLHGAAGQTQLPRVHRSAPALQQQALPSTHHRTAPSLPPSNSWDPARSPTRLVKLSPEPHRAAPSAPASSNYSLWAPRIGAFEVSFTLEDTRHHVTRSEPRQRCEPTRWNRWNQGTELTEGHARARRARRYGPSSKQPT